MTLVTDDAKPFPVVKEAPEADQLKFEFQAHQDRSSPPTWIDTLSITAEATRPLPQATPQSAGSRTSPSRAAEWVAMDHDAQDWPSIKPTALSQMQGPVASGPVSTDTAGATPGPRTTKEETALVAHGA